MPGRWAWGAGAEFGADLPPLHELVVGLAMPEELDHDPDPGAAQLERLALDLPVELGVRTAPLAPLRLVASTPTQRTATTLLPVWHRLRLTIEDVDAERA